MAQRLIGVVDRGASAPVVEYRTRERNVAGSNACEQYVIQQPERARQRGVGDVSLGFAEKKGVYCCTSFRIPGVAAANQNLAVIYNFSAGVTGFAIAVRYLSVIVQKTAALASPRVIGCSRISAWAATGSSLGTTSFDSDTVPAVGDFRSAASADGTTIGIVATPGTYAWKEIVDRMATTTTTGGHVLASEALMVPRLADNEPVILHDDEGLLVTAIDAPVTTDFYIVNCVWEEFTLP